MILILGAPRTGSTLLYQLVVNHFKVYYPANDGTLRMADKPVSYDSFKGKTKEPYEPSEASDMMERWFLQGKTVRPDRETELMTVLGYHSPFVIKNIWNVWRVDEWVRLFPDVQFVHIRRNRLDASLAYSRSMTENGHGLNDAYLTFYKQPSYQTVPRDKYKLIDQCSEQDLNVNVEIYKNLEGRNHITMWYENICNDTEWALLKLRKFLNVEHRDRPAPKLVAHVR